MKHRINIGLYLAGIILFSASLNLSAANIKGRVMADGKPLAGVQVSDGVNIVVTNDNGRYEIDSDKSLGMVFITSPSGYVPVTVDGIRPCFWHYLNLPVEQEEVHDFLLTAQKQDKYTILFPTDLHLSNDPRRNDIQRFKDIVLPHIVKFAKKASGAVYSFNLGDFTHDLYWYQFGMTEAEGLRLIQDLGYPTLMYTLMGNHDHDGAIIGEDVDNRSAWMQRNCWGPGAYSMNIGGDHWLFFDNIEYLNLPGKGKKSPGINGDRSYNDKFLDWQLEWLKKDLSYVSDDTRVYICTHCPILASDEDKVYMPLDQMEVLVQLFSRFKYDVDIFSGHVHRFDVCDNPKYPRFHQYSIPASSGMMWESPEGKPFISDDGCDSGLWIGNFKSAQSSYRFETYHNGLNQYRVYDMNEVGKVYDSPENRQYIDKEVKKYPNRKDYSKPEWQNQVWINYWGHRPGDVVKMYENGEEIEVTNEWYEDPSKNIAYDVFRLKNKLSCKGYSYCYNMYEGKCKTADAPVVIKIFDKNGKLKYTEKVKRPLPFVY